MRFLRGIAGMALAAAIAAPAVQAQYTVDYLGVRSFPAKVGGSGTQISGNLRGIDVNTNVGSPYYGYVYICDLAGMSTDNPRTSVLIYRPVMSGLGNSASQYEDTGLRIIVETDNSQFGSLQGGHGVSVGPDDTVWICDFSARQIESAPPVPPGEAATVVATPRLDLAEYDEQSLADLPQDAGWVVGNPRNLHVARTRTPDGPVDVLLVINNTGDGGQTDQTIQKFILGEDSIDYAWTHAITHYDNPNVNTTQGATGYDATTDHLGNVYVPLRAASGQIAIRKLNADGVEVPFATTPLSPFQIVNGEPTGSVDANQPGIAFVEDPSVAGGGYLYWLGRLGTNRQHGGRYSLNGDLLEPLGATFPNNPISGNILGYMEADDTGNIYIRLGGGSSNANMLKAFVSSPHVGTGDAVKSSPATSFDGVTYFGGNDGNLYAIEDGTGLAPEGTAFPVDIEALSGGSILGRVAVRHLGDGWFLYFSTSNGRVGRIPVSGDTSAEAGAWLTDPLVSATDIRVTPAVADADGGRVYIAMGDAENGASLFRLDAATGANIQQQTLAPATSVQSSPSVVDNSIYVGTDAGTFRVLDSGAGFIVSTTAGGDTSGSPFVHVNSPNGPVMYVVDSAGTVFARNATNFTAVAAFDGDADPDSGAQSGEVPLGVEVRSSLFAWNNVLYVGGADNKVYALNEADGTPAGASDYVFFDAGPGDGITSGVAVSPGAEGATLIFGSANGRYYQVSAADPSVFRAYAARLPNASSDSDPYPTPAPFDTAPSVDRATATAGGVVTTEFIGNDDGRVYRFPRF